MAIGKKISVRRKIRKVTREYEEVNEKQNSGKLS